ncbi:MAG: hypothetical protein ACYDAK_12380 [Candidatus Limnocylindrales bacterium]|nr:hypothetical protein [Chloroflexota bacterium]
MPPFVISTSGRRAAALYQLPDALEQLRCHLDLAADAGELHATPEHIAAEAAASAPPAAT